MDVGPAVHQTAGLSRYAERLASTLLRQYMTDVELTLFYNRHSARRPPNSLADSQVCSLQAGQYTWRLSVLASQLARIAYRPINSVLEGVYHATEHLLPYLTSPTVLTVHDLIFDRLPEYHTRQNRLFLKLGMPLFVRHATCVIAVSEQTKRDIVANYDIDGDRVRVIYEGIEGDFAPASEDDVHRVGMQYSKGDPYLLMVGSIEPRKNHIAAIQALDQLSRAGYPHRLLIAGGKGWMYDPILREAKRSLAAEKVSFLGYVPQTDLPALYSGATCLVHPSYYEGFGFIPLEAMACGTPVICSKAGSLPEVAGNAAILVDPDDIAGLVQSIRNIIDQPRLAETMKHLGVANAARFTWQTCARETVEVYREAIGRFSG